jgi:hypothetical protein
VISGCHTQALSTLRTVNKLHVTSIKNISFFLGAFYDSEGVDSDNVDDKELKYPKIRCPPKDLLSY